MTPQSIAFTLQKLPAPARGVSAFRMCAPLTYPNTVRAGLAENWQPSLVNLLYGVGRWRGQWPVTGILKQ